MAYRGIRSALAVGVLVLALLVGGRMLGTSHSTEQISELAQADHHAAGGQPHGADTASRSATPSPRSTTSPPTAPGQALAGVVPTTSAPPTATPPTPNAGFVNGVKHSTGSVAVALTFDDGPHPTYTPQILDLLQQQGVKATFCLVGVQVRKYPQLVARIVKEGHTLCNHSWKHDEALGKKTPDQILADLARTNAEIRKAVPGARISYYRQPGGVWTPQIVNAARTLGMIPLGWGVDPRDWDKPGTQAIISKVTEHTHAGSIVLMHDGGGDRTQTLAACHTLIPWIKARFKLTPMP